MMLFLLAVLIGAVAGAALTTLVVPFLVDLCTSPSPRSEGAQPKGREDLPPMVLTVTDWGEDFTGRDDVLGRYRWAVWSELDVNYLANLSEHNAVGWDVPHMLGNEPTAEAAQRAAERWVAENTNSTIARVQFGS